MIASFGALDSGKLEVFNRGPRKRTGQPEEIANLFAWLLSDASKYVKGSTYVMDGDTLDKRGSTNLKNKIKYMSQNPRQLT
jgi:NAD(P)-dependent dehydrogenase (short-subunit alcohol dehydrogenase family)